MTESLNPSSYRIADLLLTDRPRERLSHLGPESLTAAELIAILLRVGVRCENAVAVGQWLLDVELLDHLIIGRGRFVSLKERRLAFS